VPRKQYGACNLGRRSIVKATQKVIECVEREAARDLVSVLGAQRTSRNVTYFVILYSAVLCVLAAFRAHLRGVEYHLRQKYFLSGSQLRLVTGMELVGVVVSLAGVALFGRRCHKPMLMCVASLLCAVAFMLCAVSYFVESARHGAPLYSVTVPDRAHLPLNVSLTTTLTPAQSSAAVPDIVEYLLTELCASDNATGLSSWFTDPCVALNSTASSTYAQLTYSTVAVGVLLHGVGTGMLTTSGFVYIDENAANKAVAVFFGESNHSHPQCNARHQHRKNNLRLRNRYYVRQERIGTSLNGSYTCAS